MSRRNIYYICYSKIQSDVKALHAVGTLINSTVMRVAAEGLGRTYDRTIVVENGEAIAIIKSWAVSLLGRMGYVKCKAITKATSDMSDKEFEEARDLFLKQTVRMVYLKEIPGSFIINLDQKSIKLVPTVDWTMAAEASRRVEVRQHVTNCCYICS